ncbi:MAG: PDZ domain-containing protein [Saprospiraceae bacterium]|nr:MAG: PDZ domain-containing protein [Saprospiraceae bacterium]
MKKLGMDFNPAGIALTLAINAVFTLILFHNFEKSHTAHLDQQRASAQFTNYTNIPMEAKPSVPFGMPQDFVATANQVTSAVANISVRSGSALEGYSGGSGVIISHNGYIITNNHVVAGGGKVAVTLTNKRTYPAKVVGTDPTTDLALLKIEETGLSAMRYANSDDINVGEWVLAVGNPFNLSSTVTAGIISAKGRNINILPGMYSIESFIQTDAVVNPGNSGGALVNMAGELVGINSAIMSESGGYEGYSFAIPSNLVKKVMNDLKEFGKVHRAMLGITILDVNNEIATDLGLSIVEGVFVRDVVQASSAESAGLRVNDVIISVNGTKTRTSPELQEQVARYRPGDTVSLDVIRNNKTLRLNDVVLKQKEDTNFGNR